MNIDIIKQNVDTALNELYRSDIYLLEHDLCERCIAHRFAILLEQQCFGEGYFVDCEYNRAYSKRNGGIGTKKITTGGGNYVDIVVTKRNDNPDDDLVCFEIKKWNNSDGEEGFELDRLKLKILTGKKLPTNIKTGEIMKDEHGDDYCFNYKYGFFVIFGPTRDEVELEIFKR